MIMSGPFDTDDYILFTDSWHPTLNPSSRMPIHHLRYNALFGDRTGTLTEVPRRYGGSTLREMIFSEQGLTVRELNAPVEWFPWWKPCDDSLILRYIHDALEAGKASDDLRARESYKDYLQRYLEVVSQDASLTAGEAISKVNNDVCYEITGIVAPKLVSYTKHANYGLLISSCEQIQNDVYGILDKVLRGLGKSLLGMIAIITEYQGKSWRVRYSLHKPWFTAVNTQDESDRLRVSSDLFLSLFRSKCVLPGCVFSCLLESVVACNGSRVFHFGNAYGYFEQIAAILGLSQEERNRVGYFSDNADSWNFAEIAQPDGTGYPIHLQDIWKRPSIHGALTSLIEESYNSKETIMIQPEGTNTLEGAVLNRGA